MVRRSTPQRDIDERAFPVRVLILVPKKGFGLLLGSDLTTINIWLDREVGRGDYAHHSGVPSVRLWRGRPSTSVALTTLRASCKPFHGWNWPMAQPNVAIHP